MSKIDLNSWLSGKSKTKPKDWTELPPSDQTELEKMSTPKPEIPVPKKQSISDILGLKPKKSMNDDALVKGVGIRKRDLERGERQREKFLSDAEKVQKTELPKKAIVPKTESADFLANLAKQAPQVKKEPVPIPVVTLPTAPKEITFDESQLAALAGLEEEQFGCLIGAAGTGKTTVTNELIKRIEKHVDTIHIGKEIRYGESKKEVFNVAIAFCAFTGRAVQQIKRMIPQEYHSNATTIHRLLGFHPIWEEVPDKDNPGKLKAQMKFVPAYDASNKLPYQVIVMDESGMTPIPLWNQLWEACEPGTKVIMIGDINQLPPVQGRSVLGWAMLKWPVFELKTIHRQAQDNPIIMNAHRILRGKFPQRAEKQFDLVTVGDGSIEAKNTLFGAVQKLHKNGKFNEIDDAIIVPQNKGPLGQPMLNERFSEYFNPAKFVNGTIVNPRIKIVGGFSSFHVAVGDKMMLLQNDNELGLTNGMCGQIINIVSNPNFSSSRSSYAGSVHSPDKHIELSGDDIDDDFMADIVPEEDDEDAKKEKNQRQASHILTIRFETNVEVDFSSAGEMQKLAHAYAFTCHKSQGGEYEVVFILVHSANHKLLCREWLYTAVTRARSRVILISNNKGLAKAINRQRIKGKTLKDKIASFRALEDQKDTMIPDLPDPRKLEQRTV